VVKSSSSLAFRSLLKSAAAKAGLHKPIDRLTGLTPAASAYHAAVLAQDAPVLLVVPTDADVEQMTSDARMFIGALQGWPSATSSLACCRCRPRKSIRIAA
jgi:hypothetical protein